MKRTIAHTKHAKYAKADNLTAHLLRASLLFLLILFSFITIAHAKDDPVKITTFGDSLSAGYQLPSGAGFTDQLQSYLQDQGLNVAVNNAAVSGDTTSSGLARLDWALSEPTDIVILELGANDALQGLPIDQARKNLAAMIIKMQQKDITVILAGMRAPPNMGKAYTDKFDAIYPALAKEFGLPFYAFFLDGVAADPKLNLADGMHPNKQGIEIIVKKIAPLVIDVVKNHQ